MTAPSPPRKSGGTGRSSGSPKVTGRRYASPAAPSASPSRGRPRPRTVEAAARGRTAADAAAHRGPRPARPDRTFRGYARIHGTGLTLTTRAALLALALCAVALTLAYPAREYLAQHRQIDQLASQVSQDRQTVASLEAASQRDLSPAYVEKQARLRLHMKRPGDVVFQLPPPPPVKVGKQQAGAVRTPVLPGRSTQPWYSQLYRSTVESGK